jgi:hypothetical protein
VRADGDEGLLALDRNGNGIVDDGTEIFGEGTRLSLENRNAPNGFVALAQYDSPSLGGDDDGAITASDPVWTKLRVWLDSDANGICAPHEMSSLENAGIVSLPTIPRTKFVQDAAGNFIPYHATAFTISRPNKMEVVDVFFRGLQP